ncbi:SWIRM domain-containing protein laf1 [Sphaceloma murrayae]|uniref:SWIRM domain-containing protein laf1 n=1 Tax=Sphaceloma murrayae TaxID=2082308 RepID=A0A2K1QGK0_9PEZI|nr:SWIRM domain-containing protein laf1 [Sphaceloma murrayae]
MGPKPSLSITLPRNFTFHYNDASLPTTPAVHPQEQEQDVAEPPPPPRQTFKVRRRKADSVPRDILSDIEGDGGLPTFEMTEADAELSPDSDPGFLPGYLAPQSTSTSNRPITPPKTPVGQITYTLDNKPTSEWAFSYDRMDRPTSSCSNFSNSSASSIGSSMQSFPSLGGSCTSPESETDPFSHADSKDEDGDPMFSPDLAGSSPVAKRTKTGRGSMWNDEMDNHLLQTYAKYLADPELTPFKMLPGTAPPLGVCSRVAREAKHSWRGSKTWSHWPSNESGTRRRLRKLCKKQPSLSVHYQRLIKLRTPSPFESSSSSPRSRSSAQPSSYRPMAESIFNKSGVPQSDAPFSNFPSEPPTQPRATQRPEEWSRRIGRAQAHQKSQSLQFALGSNIAFGELESPFDEKASNTSKSPHLTTALAAPPAQSLLKSPLELHAPIPSNRSSLKRRYGILDDSPDNVNRLETLFSGVKAGPSRPVRDRSFSLGAVRHSTRNLSMSFSRPPIPEMPMPDAQHPAVSSLRSPAAEQARLGSPFAAPQLNPSFNTFPRRVTPLGSDLPLQDFRPNLSLEGRFRELAAEAARRQ